MDLEIDFKLCKINFIIYVESWEDKCARRTMRDDGELILQNLINNKHVVPGPTTGDTSW